MARLPVDPRLGRMLIEARKEHCLAEMLPIIAALESNDPRERPAEKTREADAAHARWKDGESDFIGILRLWHDVAKFRDDRGRWKRNALRKFCGPAFLNARRVMEWANVARRTRRFVRARVEGARSAESAKDLSGAASYATHPPCAAGRRAAAVRLVGPREQGLPQRGGRIFRGVSRVRLVRRCPSATSGWWRMELVETSRLWARRVARIDPEWVEQVAPHLCRSQIWRGALGREPGRGLWQGNRDLRRPAGGRRAARPLRPGGSQGGARDFPARRDVSGRPAQALPVPRPPRSKCAARSRPIEQKLRRPGGLWSDEAVLRFFEERIPEDINTAAAFHKWLAKHEDALMLAWPMWWTRISNASGSTGFPTRSPTRARNIRSTIMPQQGERDDGVTLGVHVDQLPKLPDWLPAWGVDGNLRERAEILLRSLPKDYRRVCQPIGPVADGFAELWSHRAQGHARSIRLYPST